MSPNKRKQSAPVRNRGSARVFVQRRSRRVRRQFLGDWPEDLNEQIGQEGYFVFDGHAYDWVEEPVAPSTPRIHVNGKNSYSDDEF